MNRIGLKNRSGPRSIALACVLLAIVGCDSLLEVNLPAAVTSDALDNPGVAGVLLNSIMANVECGYSTFVFDASGQEDNYQSSTGVAGNYPQYTPVAGGGSCDTNPYSQSWIDAFLVARGQGYVVYDQINGYEDVDVPDKAELLAQTAFYLAVVLDIFGEHFCEFAIDGGPLLSNQATLDIANGWVDSVFTNITRAGGDFAVTTGAGTHGTSLMHMANGLRARILWAGRDLAGGAASAALVPDAYVGWVLREGGEKRRNITSSAQGGGGGTQAAGFVQGPVQLDNSARSYWITELGSHPVTGVAWPSPVPFTGYLDLATDSEGRAVDNGGYPLTTAGATPASVTDVVGALTVDPRIKLKIGNTAGGDDNIIQKYTDLSDDIPLISWREMRLIQAEAAGASAAGTAFVNAVRAADGVGLLSGAYLTLVQTNADRFDDMLIEERRRALWLEGRFWATKILKNEKLWFPRGVGDFVNPAQIRSFEGGVRQLLQNDEYEINTNFGLDDRGAGCAAGERPVGTYPNSPA